MLALVWLFGCGAEQPHPAEPLETLRGSGWAVSVPKAAQVQFDGGILKVDSANGRSWFDVEWVDTLPTEATAMEWGNNNCQPVVFDEGIVTPNRYAVGGICEIKERRHWVVLVLERIGDRTLETSYFADSRWVPYEDAWVQFSQTALTLGGGPEPLAGPEIPTFKTDIRAAGEQMPGPIPIPGGGLLSTRIIPHLNEVWNSRTASPPTGTFSPL